MEWSLSLCLCICIKNKKSLCLLSKEEIFALCVASSLSSVKGKIMSVFLWTSNSSTEEKQAWCTACEASVTRLEELQNDEDDLFQDHLVESNFWTLPTLQKKPDFHICPGFSFSSHLATPRSSPCQVFAKRYQLTVDDIPVVVSVFLTARTN